MTIMFAGDIHGNTPHLKWLFRQAERNNVRHILAVGDFGFWPHYPDGRDFIDTASKLSIKTGVTLWWVDGNHENHDVLDAIVADEGDRHPIRLSGDLWYIPRGCVTDIDGRTVMGYGGAVSVDRKWRSQGKTWWRQEEINEDHVKGLPSIKVDILATHEAPTGAHLSYKDDDVGYVFDESRQQRVLVDAIADKVTPTIHVCGHHHVRKTWEKGNWHREITTVHVLNRDESGEESFLIL